MLQRAHLKVESVRYGVAIVITFFTDILESVVHIQTWSTLMKNSKKKQTQK